MVLQFTAAANGAANVTVNGTITPTPSRKNSRNSWAGNSNYSGSAYSTMERNPRRSRLSTTQGPFPRPNAVGILKYKVTHQVVVELSLSTSFDKFFGAFCPDCYI